MEVSVEMYRQFKEDIKGAMVMSFFVLTITVSIGWKYVNMETPMGVFILLAIFIGVFVFLKLLPVVLIWLFRKMLKGAIFFISIIKKMSWVGICYLKKNSSIRLLYQIKYRQDNIQIFRMITPNIVDTADDTLIIGCLPELAVVQEQPIEQSKKLSNDVVFSTEVRRVDYFLQKQKELQQAREDVLYYTRFVWAPFLSDEDLKRLCEYTEMYIDNITVGKVPLLKIQGNLNYQDIFCWAWHVWKYLKKQNKSYNKNDLGNLLKSIFDLENWKDAKVIEKKLSRKNKGEFIKDTIGTCLENRDKKI